MSKTPPPPCWNPTPYTAWTIWFAHLCFFYTACSQRGETWATIVVVVYSAVFWGAYLFIEHKYDQRVKWIHWLKQSDAEAEAEAARTTYSSYK
jgi:hypothetical protein